SVGKLVPKMKKTAKILYMLYIALTVINVIFLLCGGMPLFDSVCTAFSTAGTGGFGTRSDSIASFSPYIQVVCTVFMILFGINFNCFYLIMLRHFKDVFKNSELKLYLGLILTSSVLITLDLLHGGLFEKVSDAARHGAFQVASIITTTGFASTDFDAWPNLSKGILLCLMLIGACAGSTGGGIKCARVLLLFKSFTRSIRSAARPQRVQVMRLNGQVIDETVLSATNVYLVAYVVIIVISFLIVSVDGFSVTTNVSAVASCFNNIGPGFEKVGPAANYSQFSIVSKITLIIDMLAGRLEIFPILTLLAKDTWKN
ncbi:MAG: TrkH family potassium uptake protein, partial [Clostridia bacterium]|nr:TrkH family potassium uptake protein [Clostridia bacterium]